jgi:hypothetical protein
MGKTYKYDPENELRPVDVEMRKHEARRPRDRWDIEFEEHQMAQTSDHRASLPVTRYRTRPPVRE